MRLRDRISPDGSALDPVRVRAEETGHYARRASGGFYVLCNLPPGTHRLVVESPHYHLETRTIDLPAEPGSPPMLDVELKPNRMYPMPDGMTLLRGAVQEAGGQWAIGASVTAALNGPHTTVKARLKEPASAGDDELRLTSIQGELKAGDILYVRNAEFGKSEYVVLRAPLPADPATGPWLLAAPLGFSHPANAPLNGTETQEIVQTFADGDGEYVLPFIRANARAMLARIVLASAAGGGTLQLDASVQEGRTVSLGTKVFGG